MRRWTAASLWVVAALFGWVTRLGWLSATLVVALLVALRFPILPKRPVGRVVTVLALALGAALGSIVRLPVGEGILRRPWPAVALAGLLVGTVRLALRPIGEPSPLEMLPGLLALMACGETSAGPVYLVAVVAWIAFTLLARRAADPGRPAWRAIPQRDHLLAIVLAALGTGMAVGSAVTLPRLATWIQRRILHALGSAQTGFSDRMWIGSLDGMLDSSEVVLRMYGRRVDYLRGAVFDRYDIGRWDRVRKLGLSGATRGVAFTPGAPRTRMSVVSGARDRYFLPLGAHAVSTSGAVEVDRFGIARVAEGTAGEASFDLEGPPDFPVDLPDEADLELPAHLRRTLLKLASEWSAGAATTEAKLDAIVARLRTDFSYAREFERRRADPLLDFLLDDHRGHCEYFASATALLARAVGIPARVAVGYRVVEENTLGGYWMVREKHAHAWAEVYLSDKGFVTMDATPADDAAVNVAHRAGWIRAVVDLVASLAAGAWDGWTIGDGVEAGSAVVVVGLVVRRLQQKRGAWRERTRRDKLERVPKMLERLLAALGRQGLVRTDAEPIERFAERVEERGAVEAAAALRCWAAFRYGGVGEEDEVTRTLEACTRRLLARSPRSGSVSAPGSAKVS